jgi:hypothetical protein
MVAMIGDALPYGGPDCATNPTFCHASAVHVPYCTGDTHRGNHTDSAATWGLWFDGHANFARIVDKLIADYGLADATHVLLAGGSAGAVGALFNVDYLAQRLGEGVVVKGAPEAGWFTPAALPEDGGLGNVSGGVFPPSDWAHFKAGTHGKGEIENTSFALQILEDVWQAVTIDGCIAAQMELGDPYPSISCGSLHTAYKHIRSPLFITENQYDAHQVFKSAGLPTRPDAAELPKAEAYLAMYGEAMRNSTQQVLDDEALHKPNGTDGLFHPSCLSHMVTNERVQGLSYREIVADWFWGDGKLKQHYRMVETCPQPSAGLPCNANKQCKRLGPAPGPAPSPPAPSKCAAALNRLCPRVTDPNPPECVKCAHDNKVPLGLAGCNAAEIGTLCRSRDV